MRFRDWSGGPSFLKLAKEETGLPIVTEIMDPSQLELFGDVDVIQVGAQHMQNFNLLKASGTQDKPCLSKGAFSTYEEWLMSAENVMSQGNENVILCERAYAPLKPLPEIRWIGLYSVLRGVSRICLSSSTPSHATPKANLVSPRPWPPWRAARTD
jgi:3-deoxy-7-phosphoheptulonate synthase